MTTSSRGATAAVAGSAVAAVAVAALAFWLSFASLADLAARFGVPAGQAWAFPLVVDGLVVVSTVAAAAMTRHRWYAWALLVVGTIVSVAGNGIHAWHLTASSISVGIAVIPPLVTLAAIHLTIMLAQQGRDTATGKPVTSDVSDFEHESEDVPDAIEPAPRPVTRLHVARPVAVRDSSAEQATLDLDVAPPTAAADALRDEALRDEALRLVADGLSVRAAGEQLGVSKDRVHRWVKAHRDRTDGMIPA